MQNYFFNFFDFLTLTLVKFLGAILHSYPFSLNTSPRNKSVAVLTTWSSFRFVTTSEIGSRCSRRFLIHFSSLCILNKPWSRTEKGRAWEGQELSLPIGSRFLGFVFSGVRVRLKGLALAATHRRPGIGSAHLGSLPGERLKGGCNFENQ